MRKDKEATKRYMAEYGQRPYAKKKQAMARKIWAATPRGRYKAHIHRAKRRGIEFTLTWEQWWELWEPFWQVRRIGKVCMMRYGDQGGYTPGNVRIGTWEENRQEQKLGRDELGRWKA